MTYLLCEHFRWEFSTHKWNLLVCGKLWPKVFANEICQFFRREYIFSFFHILIFHKKKHCFDSKIQRYELVFSPHVEKNNLTYYVPCKTCFVVLNQEKNEYLCSFFCVCVCVCVCVFHCKVVFEHTETLVLFLNVHAL